MLIVQALINANKKWVDRAGQRWDAAALGLNQGAYEARHLFRDVFQSVVTDPFDWYLDLTRETETTRILIDVRGGLPGDKSDFIPARNPQNTDVTTLSRLGGTEQMLKGTHVDVRRPAVPPAPPNPIPDGTVQIVVTGLTGAQPPGIYMGFLIENKLPLAYVVALR